MLDAILHFVLQVPPDFHREHVNARPGDKFARCTNLRGEWVYVEILALNDGTLPEGSMYAKGYSRDCPYGFEGHCRLEELDLRLDAEAWARVRRAGWGPPSMTIPANSLGPDPRSDHDAKGVSELSLADEAETATRIATAGRPRLNRWSADRPDFPTARGSDC
jgi:hypothetical protein